jgi:hypothetical protein
MGSRRATTTLLCVMAGAVALASCEAVDPETGALRPECKDVDSDPATPVDFARDIRPLIDNKVPGTHGCLLCHDPNNGTREGFAQTGLDLTKLQTLRKGASNGVVIVPGKPCESPIVQKLQGTFNVGARMPKNGPFWGNDKIQRMIDWIAEGAQGADE